MRKVLLCGILLILCAAAITSGNVRAQITESGTTSTFDLRKLLVPHKNLDGSIRVVPFLTDPVLWVRGEQQNFYGAMSRALRATRDGNAFASGLTLMFLSFGYGVFHAAGPGHGKAVISAWLLATENQLRRGILVAFMSAIVQAFTAVSIVSVLFLVVAGVGTAAKDVSGFLETASYALIATMGGYLLWTGIKPLLTMGRPIAFATESGQKSMTNHLSPDHHFEILNFVPHDHGADCDCGHDHAPSARDVTASLTWYKAFSLAFAVGIRPCTGALLVLVFANTIGIYWAGVAATFAMAFGTFITVSVVATIAVYSKKLAERLAARDTRWLGWLTTGLRLAGGAGILIFGIILMLGSLGGPSGSG